MNLKKVALGRDIKLDSEVQKPQLTLAAMYLEEKLNKGLVIEIPSLGISLSKSTATNPKKADKMHSK